MALTEQGANVLTGAINAVGTYFLAKPAAKAAAGASKAQQKLIELQQEEQRLRNRALAQSFPEQNASLPFAISNPSLPAGAYAGGVAPSSPSIVGATQTASPGITLVLGLAVVAIVGWALSKAA